MPRIAKLKLPDGRFEDHLLLTTKEQKEFGLMDNNIRDEFYKTQQNNSIDTLTSQLTKMTNEEKQLEKQLDLKRDQVIVTQDVLRDKLESKLAEIHTNDEPEVLEPEISEELDEIVLERERAGSHDAT